METIPGKGRRSRNKGKRGEREVIDMLQPIVDYCYKMIDEPAPRLQRNTLQADGGGHDVTGLDAVGVSIEVKRQEILKLDSWWKQCTDQAWGAGKAPVLFYRQSKAKWRVRMLGYLPHSPAQMVVDIASESFCNWLYWRLVDKLHKT